MTKSAYLCSYRLLQLFGLLECRSAGFDDFFVKPADMNILLKAAQDALKSLRDGKGVPV